MEFLSTLVTLFIVVIALVVCYFLFGRTGKKSTPASRKENHAIPGQGEECRLPPKKMSDHEKIQKLAASDPERASELIRQWLHEDKK